MPLDDALKFGHDDVVEYLDEYEEKLRLGLRIGSPGQIPLFVTPWKETNCRKLCSLQT